MICHLDAYDDDDYDVRDHEIECFDIKGRRLVTTKASEAQNPSLVARPCPNRELLLITNVDVDIGTFCGDYIMFTFLVILSQRWRANGQSFSRPQYVSTCVLHQSGKISKLGLAVLSFFQSSISNLYFTSNS